MRRSDRPYRDGADRAAIFALLQRVYARSGPHVPFTVGDLAYWLAQESEPEPLASARLWFADEELVGFVWPEPGRLDLIVHPEHASALPAMLDWGEEWQAERSHESVAVRALDGDASYRALLRGRGYAPRGDAFSWYGVRPLPDAPDAPSLPTGTTIRDAGEPAAMEALHRAVRAGPPIHCYRTMQRSPIYRVSLDLVAYDADGDAVAFALVWFHAENRCGLFEPVGCLAAHRRRGLASALMTEGLRRLHALGATHALVANHESNAAADRTYRGLGFVTADRIDTWTKSLGTE